MLTKKRIHDYRSMITLGQISLILGIFGTRIFRMLISSSESTSQFLLGFMDGISIVLITVSIVLHVRGALLYRKCEVKKSERRNH